ncbi:hypothetical protein BU24DRAFT_257275 [Aaosphaeria arxii CBS 175.79]|uniref:Uncharacterized protein n=1 Tax=Aaosphaeria arxii CBS 175.79 TaxID=1450172 RepID=A0A6A5XK73_9PLEO|nr:uncharacterized protein BU24DRAFT_257275 [Aaosphaeria arxii CBS 175.79]KAF2012694.1 hypothetical protein BU24DRAFT_257275 [Aaosphaeria arxii CBS 175.79]
MILRNVNKRLVEEGIPEVTEDILRWRMSNAFKKISRYVHLSCKPPLMNVDPRPPNLPTLPYDPTRSN